METAKHQNNKKNNFGRANENIKLLRKYLKLSQKEFGKIFFSSPQRTVSSWEQDERKIPLEVVFTIKHIFGIDADELYELEEGEMSKVMAERCCAERMAAQLAAKVAS